MESSLAQWQNLEWCGLEDKYWINSVQLKSIQILPSSLFWGYWWWNIKK